VSLTNSPSNYVFTKTYTTASTYNITHTVKDNANATVADPHLIGKGPLHPYNQRTRYA